MKKALRIVMIALALFWCFVAYLGRESFNLNFTILIGVTAVVLILGAIVLPMQPKQRETARAASPAPAAAPASVSVPSGSYEYEYSGNGVYRPATVSLPLPPVGAVLTFEEDPENVYDADAIKAVWNGQTVGWLYRKGKREMIRDWINRGDEYLATVTANTPELKFWIGMNK